MAYEQVEGPVGPLRDDLLVACLRASIEAPWVEKGARRKLEDLMPPWFERQPRPWQEIRDELLVWARAHNRTQE